jgi:hypothetical protein
VVLLLAVVEEVNDVAVVGATTADEGVSMSDSVMVFIIVVVVIFLVLVLVVANVVCSVLAMFLQLRTVQFRNLCVLLHLVLIDLPQTHVWSS